MSEVITSVNDLKVGTVSGPDGIIAKMIWTTLHEIVSILLPFKNKMLSTREFPVSWSKSI